MRAHYVLYDLIHMSVKSLAHRLYTRLLVSVSLGVGEGSVREDFFFYKGQEFLRKMITAILVKKSKSQ